MIQFDMLPPKVKNIAGKRFGRLIARDFVELRPRGSMKRAIWRCVCDCGSETDVAGTDLRSGNTRSCGCLLVDVVKEVSRTHGHASNNGRFSGAYRSWRSMVQRCRDPRSNNWHNYGARGIRVCERWEQFENFLADMGDRPEGGSLERIDPNGHYEPGNCKWIPRSEQAKNTRANRYVLLNGEKMIQADAARALGVTPQKLSAWVRHPHRIPASVPLQALTA